MNLNRQLPLVDQSHFAMVPRNDVPRSTFQVNHSYKSTFNTDLLIPIHVQEVLPGDVFSGQVKVFARLNNLIFPLMDDLTLETFFFFCPCRLVWSNWEKFMGEQVNPSDSIAFLIPQTVSPVNGFAINSIFDYMGIPCVGQITAGNTISVNVLPLRAYNLIYQEWFRDENLINSPSQTINDGPDPSTNFALKKRAKRHDYFTSALPWPLKGGVEATLPLGGIATVKTNNTQLVTTFPVNGTTWVDAATGANMPGAVAAKFNGTTLTDSGTAVTAGTNKVAVPTNLYADLATATGPAINAMRLAIATQQFLEKDARGGTRYAEVIRNHFGVLPEDFRLQRPEFIGGGRSQIHTTAIPQTSATGLTGGSTPLGGLTGQALVSDQHRYRYFAKEHGYIIGLANVSGDITYQQGLHRQWTRQTRFDFYWPTFQNLGEQAIRNDELYCVGGTPSLSDSVTFGYQERWAEYRYYPSRITGMFNSKHAAAIDGWTLAQNFSSLPILGQTFIEQSTPMARVLAAGASADNMQILFDSFWTQKITRPIPTYSVPGLTRF